METPTVTARAQVSLVQRLAAARARTDELFALVSGETLYERPIPARQRIIFYLGHLEAYDWALIGRQACGLPPVDSTLDALFCCESSASRQPLGDQRGDWPTPTQIAGYSRRVREAVNEQMEALANTVAQRPQATAFLFQAAIEHRFMHAETLAYMLHQLPSDRKSPREGCPSPSARPVAPRMVDIPAGSVTLGMQRGEGGSFGWDNEFEEHRVGVPAFQIDACKVTNRDFLHFLANGGYQERSLWGEADWEWLQASGISHPVFWTLHGNRLFLRTMFDEMPLPMDWPVYVSHAEASAYARWTGKELPSEAEWHRAAYGTPDGSERPYPWGHDLPDPSRGNFDFQRWDATPVSAFPAGASAWGVEDLAGNGWEWTRTLFAPFPGFEPARFHPGYSTGSFDTQNYVLKGGSARTAARFLRRSYRNWGRPRDPFRYAGFRCVRH